MWHKLKKVFTKLGIPVVFYTILLELFEELLEEAIAYMWAQAIVKVVSVFFVIGLTQTTKYAIKKTIKLITYKQGADKMDQLKTILKWIFANKKSLLGTLGSASIAGGGIAASWAIDGLPQLLINGFDIAPILYTIACLVFFALSELGICGKGFECIKAYGERIQLEKQMKEIEKAEKEAKLKEDRIKADALALLEEEKKAAEEQAKQEEKKKEDEEYRKVVEQYAEQLRKAN